MFNLRQKKLKPFFCFVCITVYFCEFYHSGVWSSIGRCFHDCFNFLKLQQGHSCAPRGWFGWGHCGRSTQGAVSQQKVVARKKEKNSPSCPLKKTQTRFYFLRQAREVFFFAFDVPLLFFGVGFPFGFLCFLVLCLEWIIDSVISANVQRCQ